MKIVTNIDLKCVLMTIGISQTMKRYLRLLFRVQQFLREMLPAYVLSRNRIFQAVQLTWLKE